MGRNQMVIGCGIYHDGVSMSGGRVIFREDSIKILGGFIHGADYEINYGDIDTVYYCTLWPRIKITLRYQNKDLPELLILHFNLFRVLKILRQRHVNVKRKI